MRREDGSSRAKAVEKASGPTWEGPLRVKFMQLSDILLSVAPDALWELTTIYVNTLCRRKRRQPGLCGCLDQELEEVVRWAVSSPDR